MAKYRDKVTGVVGVAIDTSTDDGKLMTRLRLDQQHVDDTPGVPKGHQNRWYDNDRLEPVGG